MQSQNEKSMKTYKRCKSHGKKSFPNDFFNKLLAIFILTFSFPSFSMTTYEFRKLRGYTISAITKTEGEFHGCSPGKKIRLENGMSFVCETEHADYTISPDVIIFSLQQGSVHSSKAVINSRVYNIKLIYP